MFHTLTIVVSLIASILAHEKHEQATIAGPHKSLWYNALPGDGGTQVRPSTFKYTTNGSDDYRLIPFSRASRPLDAYPTLHA